ncbi:thioredoxin [Alteromonadaceae bacterium 2753L.S.0a.02]|nr:thioredoxin [Alteromonadaceae bacterium 2753L.S.0a.02]
MSEHIVQISPENAQQLLIDESFKRPVLIDFWADWCAPCKDLMPILEKLVNEYQGELLLAKVNADEQQMIAAQFGVRSLPTVMLMKDGQPVDGFVGAQPEVQIRELLEKYLPKPWDKALQKAQNLIEDEDYNAALPLLQEAYRDSQQQADIALALADVLLELKRLSDAEEVLSAIKMVDQEHTYHNLMAKLELAREAGKAPEIEALEQKLKENPNDKQTEYLLALQYSQHDFHAEALELLYGLIKHDLNFNEGEARKTYTDILAVLGKGDPLAVEYQRKMYTLLY